ncbi:MAG: arylamine N-acetyltransferase family protein [Tepidiformaceae bacterium]
MDIDAYLARIGYEGPRTPTLETLRGMQRAHFFNVPFENLDILAGVPIEVDEQVNFDKIVGRRRGGYCLELNGTFSRVLRQMGFRLDVLAARVLTEGYLSPPFSHMSTLVHLDEPWLADVGFGGRLIAPLRLHESGVQAFGERRYLVANDGDHWFLTTLEEGSPPMTYVFMLTPHQYSEFLPVNTWLQTSPDSRFTRGEVVSLATEHGRLTLAPGRLIVTDGDQRSEQPIDSPEERATVLRQHFGIEL